MEYHTSFWKQFGNFYKELEFCIFTELMEATLTAEQDWDQHKIDVKLFISSWEDHSPPIIQNTNRLTSDEFLIHQNIVKLHETTQRIQKKIGSTYYSLESAQKLAALISHLESYYDSLLRTTNAPLVRYESDVDLAIIIERN